MSKSTPKTKKPVLINILLDESGSMISCKDETISGFNEYIQTLKTQAPNAFVSVTKFNSDGVTELCKGVSVKDVPVLSDDNYCPSAGTPLYDAIGRTIESGKKFVKKNDNINALMVIQTDGYENQSREYNRDQIKDLMEDTEKKGWTFVFLGGDLDTAHATHSMGLSISVGNQSSYARSDTRAFMRDVLATSTIAYATSGGVQTSNFFDASKTGE